MKEIYIGTDASNLIMQGVTELANVVKTTMGPYGKTVIISDSNGNPYVTKDGVSVAQKIAFKDPVKNIGANLLKGAAKKTVEEAGDGTTTSICLAYQLIEDGIRMMLDGTHFNTIKQRLDELEKYTIDKLIERSEKVNPEDIYNVAHIASNNDEVIANLIDTAYKGSKVVKVETSTKEHDECEVINGIKLNTGYFDKAFINNASKQSIEHGRMLLILVDGHLTELKHLEKTIMSNADGICIIADHFSDAVVSIFRQAYNKGALNICLVKSPGFAGHRKDLMRDIGLFTGTDIIDPNKAIPIGTNFGFIDSIKATSKEVLITKEACIPEAIQLATELKKSLDGLDETQKDLTKQRIDVLTGSMSIIRVGGKSELEMLERKDRVDDAVLAVSCALEEGIIEGGGKALQLVASTIDNPFASSLYAPKFTILDNGASIDYTQDFFKLGIIDPIKVTRVALKNAISVAKTILSTEAVVINDRLWI